MDGEGAEGTWYLAECLWPGLTDDGVQALDERVRASVTATAPAVRYLGSLVMPDDEVLFCLFSGRAEDVRAASEGAAVPFERIVPYRAVGLGLRRADEEAREKG